MISKILHDWPNNIIIGTKSDFFESLQYSIPIQEDLKITTKEDDEFQYEWEEFWVVTIEKWFSFKNKNGSFTYIFPWLYWFIVGKWHEKWELFFRKKIKYCKKDLSEIEMIVLKRLVKFQCISAFWIRNDKNYIPLNGNGLFRKKTLLYLSFTNRCNLNCPFCIADSNNHIDKEDSESMCNIIDNIERFLKKRLESGDNNIYKIGITWWEPFLRKDIFSLLNKIHSHDNVEYNITTNWTLLSDHMLSIIKKQKINLIFSLDWSKAFEHDLFRWSWSFSKTIASIKKCKNMSIPFFINSFLYKGNQNLITDRIKLFDELWALWINFLNSFGRWRDSSFFYQSADEGILFDEIFSFLKKNPKKTYLFKNISLFYSVFLRILLWAKLIHSWSWISEPMMAGSNWKLYLTPALFWSDDYYLGNICDQPLETLLWRYNDKINNILSRNIDKMTIDDEELEIFKYFFWGENLSENVIFKKNLHPSYLNRIKTIKKVFSYIAENGVFLSYLL